MKKVQKMEQGGKPGYYWNGEKFVKSKGTGTFNNGVYFKEGGKVNPPIKTSDIKKVQAYNDSLALYNKYNGDIKGKDLKRDFFFTPGNTLTNFITPVDSSGNYKTYKKRSDEDYPLNFKPEGFYNSTLEEKDYNNPRGIKTIDGDKYNPSGSFLSIPKYKKPIQPYTLELINNQVPQYISQNVDPGQLNLNIPYQTNQVYDPEVNPEQFKKGGWIQGAVNKSHAGYCTPMSKKTCTPHRKALAKRFKSGDLHKEYGGLANPLSKYIPKMEFGGEEEQIDLQPNGPNAFAQDNQNSQQTMDNVYAPVNNAETTQIDTTGQPMVTSDNPTGSGTNLDYQVQGQQPVPQQATSIQKAAAWGQAGNNILGAALITGSYFNNMKHDKDLNAYNRALGMSDNMAKVNQPNSKGIMNQQGYNPNGYVSQNQSLFYPKMEYGGAMPNTGVTNGNTNRVLDNNWSQLRKLNNTIYNTDSPYATRNTLPESENPDIYVEKQEQILGDFKGDGSQQLMGVNADTHDSGQDIGVNVPEGSFVFSDTKDLKIKDKDILKNFTAGSKAKTPAQLAKKYDLQKFQAIIDNPQSDDASKKTAEMMVTNYSNKLGQLSQLQESMKMALDTRKQQKMQYGGKVPKYPGGGNYSKKKQYLDPITGEPLDYDTRGVYDPNTGVGFNVGNSIAQRRFSPLPTNNAGSYQEPRSMDTANIYTDGMSWMNQQTVNAQQQPTSTPNYMSPEFATNSTSNYQLLVPETKQAELQTKQWNTSPTANQWSDFAMGTKALGLKKFVPVNPQINAVIPQTVLESDIPVRNALAENTNAATNAMYTGDAKAGRANALALQGTLGKNAINAVGEITNRNVNRLNQGNATSAEITNRLLDAQRQRAIDLGNDTFNAERLYRGEQNQLLNEFVQNKKLDEMKVAKLQNMNFTNPYYYADSVGQFHLKPGVTQADYDRITKGSQGSNYQPGVAEKVNGIYQELIKQPAYQGEYGNKLALQTAQKMAGLGEHQQVDYDSAGTKKKSTEKGVYTGPTQKFGGFTPNKLSKFVKSKVG